MMIKFLQTVDVPSWPRFIGGFEYDLPENLAVQLINRNLASLVTLPTKTVKKSLTPLNDE